MRLDHPLPYSATQMFSITDLTNAGWTKANASVAQDIAGPEAVKGFTLTRVAATSNTSVRRSVSTTRATHVTFSIYARKGTLSILRLWLEIGGRHYVPQNDIFLLDDNWRLFSVTVPMVPTATTVTCWMLAGTTTGLVGTIQVADPRAVEADSPAQSLPRIDVGVIPTASLPAAGAGQDGRLLIEDAGTGDRNLVVYAGGQRFRIDGGASF